MPDTANIAGILRVPYDGEPSGKEKITFTKSIMIVIMLLYFIGFILGGVLVILAALADIRIGGPLNTGMFIAYAAYIGGPTATAISFYAWKSKAENVLKIHNSASKAIQKECDSTLASVLANMGG